MTQMTGRLALLALALSAACGSAPAHHAASLRSEPTTDPSSVPVAATAGHMARPEPSLAPRPYFRTPQAAMRFMARAWNDGNLEHLKWVTDPTVRVDLTNMHREAVNLRLTRCEMADTWSKGWYMCYFSHDYPRGYHGQRDQRGGAVFMAGPVSRTGWYMTEYVTCG